jgi:hypothetical protein
VYSGINLHMFWRLVLPPFSGLNIKPKKQVKNGVFCLLYTAYLLILLSTTENWGRMILWNFSKLTQNYGEQNFSAFHYCPALDTAPWEGATQHQS